MIVVSNLTFAWEAHGNRALKWTSLIRPGSTSTDYFFLINNFPSILSLWKQNISTTHFKLGIPSQCRMWIMANDTSIFFLPFWSGRAILVMLGKPKHCMHMLGFCKVKKLTGIIFFLFRGRFKSLLYSYSITTKLSPSMQLGC